MGHALTRPNIFYIFHKGLPTVMGVDTPLPRDLTLHELYGYSLFAINTTTSNFYEAMVHSLGRQPVYA
jgi:hypothetical protein